MSLHGETLPTPGSWQDKIVALDCALTRCRTVDALRTLRNQRLSSIADLASRVYYLSDGGYSRIGFHLSGNVTLADSTEATRKQWEFCRELIADVRQAYQSAVE